MSHFTLTVRPSAGGARRFAVTSQESVADSDWSSNRNIWSQADQTWEASVWQRIEGRGYICRLEGGGQWSNRGDHGVYIGTGVTAEAALLDAWRHRGDNDDDYDSSHDSPPRSLIAPMRDHDAEANPLPVE